ncbi:hypothetical protein PS627_00043 [Pseudomonas fluorescens]|nr:hypothetical protein PS627_00043 [Pseudomonas fluorescens]
MKQCDDIPNVYHLGRECRRNGGTKLANPFTAATYHGSWWLAVFHDADIEICAKKGRRRA